MVVALPSVPVKSDDGYHTVASLLLLFGLVDDVGGGGGNLERPDMNRRRKRVIHVIVFFTQRVSVLHFHSYLVLGARQ